MGVCDMYLEDFYQLAQSRQLQVSRDSAFGVYRGWPIMLACMGRGLKTHDDRPIGIRVLLCFSSNVGKPLLKQIKKRAKHLAWKIYLVHGRELQIWFKESTQPDIFCSALDQMLDFFTEQQLVSPTACPFCHTGDCDATAAWGSSYLPVHRACLEHTVESQRSAIEENSLTGNYVTGFLGALVGSFVGVLPSLLLVWAAGSVSGWLVALIPIASYQGYKIARGRLNRVSIVFFALFSLLQLFVIIETQYYHFIVNYYHLYPSIFSTIAQSFQSGDFFALLGETWVIFLFLAVGVLISNFMLSKSGAPHIEALDNTLSTVLPYHANTHTDVQAPAPAPLKPGDAGPAIAAATALAEKDPRGN